MADNIQICNLALGKIGSPGITSLNEASQSARYCKLFFEQTRDEVLQSAPWNFAIKRVTLSRLTEAPAFGWTYQYQLPTNYLSVVQLNSWAESEARDLS